MSSAPPGPRREEGPTPAIHGVVRWRIVDLCQWLFETFRICVSETTVSRELRKMGYRKLSARPRHHAQCEGAIEDFKKTSARAWRRSRRKGVAARRHRDLVFRRSPRRPEEQDHAALGQARLAPFAPKDQRTASTYIFGAISPKDGKGAALVLPQCDTYAMNLHLAEISKRVAPGAHAVLLLDQAGWHTTAKLNYPQTSPSAAAGQVPRTQPHRERLAVPARQLAVQPRLQLLR